MPNNVVRLTQATRTAPATFDMPGQIPQDPVRVVFQDDNYDPPKDDGYNPNGDLALGQHPHRGRHGCRVRRAHHRCQRAGPH